MKKSIYRMAVLGYCICLATSCSLEEENLTCFELDPQAIKIEALLGESPKTLARMNEEGTLWTNGDHIHVREANTGETVKYTYTTSKWIPTGTDYLRWESGSLPGALTTFDAWYPQNATGYTDFTLPHVTSGVADQSSSTLLMEADWMVAHQVASPGEAKTPLTLKFERKMVKVAVKVCANSEFFDGGTIKQFRICSAHSSMNGNVGDNASIPIHPLTKDIGGNVQTGEDVALSFTKTGGPTYTAIVFPTEEKGNNDFITLTVTSKDGSTSQDLELTDTPELKPGYFYTFTLKTGKARLEIASVSVEDWIDGDFVGGTEGNAVKWDYIGDIEYVGETQYENAYFWNHDEEYSVNDMLNCKYIYMPYVLEIAGFANNISIYTERIVAPKCKRIETNAFMKWPALKEVDFPETSEIGINAFMDCTQLSNVNIPKSETIGTAAFSGCSSLKEIAFPKVTVIEGDAFSGCSKLTFVSLPSAKEVKRSAFLGCSSLMFINLPSVTSVGAQSFKGCSALTSISLPSAKSVDQKAFMGCDNLRTLILGTNHTSDLTITPKDSGAETMTSQCVLIIGIGTSGEGATSGVAKDFELSTTKGYESLYSWAGLPWKQIIVKNAAGDIIKTYE